MMHPHRLILALLVLLLPLIMTTAEARYMLIGGWHSIENINDPHVKEIAEFAVSEHNKVSQNKLVFRSVVRGETQVVAGLKYRLVIRTKNNDTSADYEGVVWEKVWENFRKLISLHPIKN